MATSGRRTLVALAIALTVGTAGCTHTGGSGSASVSAPSISPGDGTPTRAAGATPASSLDVNAEHPCVGAAPRTYQHVVWIVMENKADRSVIGSSSAPALNRFANRCAVATDYRAITHPSLPNYLALTSGSTHGVADDAGPDVHLIRGASIFSAVADHGDAWATYAEAMPRPCDRSSGREYAVKHNPAVYYTALASTCAAHDVPLGAASSGPFASALADGTLPAFSLVVPDLCDDTHDCPVAVGDRWLDRWLTLIVSSSTYRAGGTAVFVTWDEDDSAHSNHVGLVALAPTIHAGARATGAFTHLSLLRTTEDLLGLTQMIGPSVPSMRPALGI